MPTALIAESEPLLRSELRARLVAAWPELRVVAEAAHGAEAIELAVLHEPDLAFLDLRLPVRSGLDVARALGQRCHVVFVTAADPHVVAALVAAAVDYLPLPPTVGRVAALVARLKARVPAAPPDIAALIARLAADNGAAPLRWIRASSGATPRLLAVDDVLFFRAEDKHTRVVTVDAEMLIRKPVRELQDELDPEAFGPIRRGTIVNLRAIARVDHDARGAPVVVLAGRAEPLAVSRRFAPRFEAMRRPARAPGGGDSG
ncbi:MAG: response regulator transcription factor [Betaproteobacteria bacterium]|nr:response regulator transcription factor [Betaproteobacteria bacterium]